MTETHTPRCTRSARARRPPRCPSSPARRRPGIAARPYQSLLVVAGIEAVHTPPASAARCVDELALADVDADVGDALARRVEEDEVALFHRAAANPSAAGKLPRGGVRQADALLPV